MIERLRPDLLNQLRTFFTQSFYWACVNIFEFQFETSWLSPLIHKPLCDALQDPTKTRLAIILPRDWLKSTICSIYYPTWRAMLDENFTSLICLNTFTNATKKLLAIRALIKNNPLLAQMFPERMPDSSCQQSAEAFSLPRKAALADATFEAAGVGTDVTSRHKDYIDEDDTIAPEFDHMTGDVCEPSEDQVEKAKGLHKALHFLLRDFRTGKRVVVGTRWRQNDLFSDIIEKEPNYQIFTRAARELDGKPNPNGEPTYPERFDDAVLEEIRNAVGDYMFSALMLNLPLAAKDMLFDLQDIMQYESPPSDLMVYTTVDPAPFDSKSARKSDPDYNVVLTAGISLSGQGCFVLDYFRDRCNPSDLIDVIFNHVETYKPFAVGIETVAYQKTLQWWVEEMMFKRRVWFNVEALKTSNLSKPARVRGLQPIVRARRLFLRPWMTLLRQEIASYASSGSRGAHDDLIDALAYQLEFWRHVELSNDRQVKKGSGRFIGRQVLEEAFGRLKVKGYPKDVMGFDGDGRVLRPSDLGFAPATQYFNFGHGVEHYSFTGV